MGEASIFMWIAVFIAIVLLFFVVLDRFRFSIGGTASAVTEFEIERLWLENMNGLERELGVYDCTNFSNDFKEVLSENGIESVIGVGRFNATLYHCWNVINGSDFEPQTGRFEDMNYTFIGYYSYCPEYI